jgi:hypothetical protein
LVPVYRVKAWPEVDFNLSEPNLSALADIRFLVGRITDQWWEQLPLLHLTPPLLCRRCDISDDLSRP